MQIGNKDIEVKQYRNDWALALMNQGIIVKLTIGRWGGTASLKADELGLKFHDEAGRKLMNRYISLGREKLLPPEVECKIRRSENMGRDNLKAFSFPTVWGYFVPYTAFEAWQAENERIRQEFFVVASEVSNEYLDIIEMVKTAYRGISKDVWRRLYPTTNDEPPASFTENFVNKIIDKIPSRTDILASFKYDITYFTIPMPSIIEENLSKARKEERQREMEDFQAILEQNTKEKVAEEYLKRKEELIDGFLESTVASIRKHVAELCDSILQSMVNQSTKRDISRIQRKKVKKIIEKVKMLNFYDDKEMDSLLKSLETEIDKFKGERDHKEIVSTLQKIVDIGTEEFIPKDFNPSISILEI